MKQIMYPFIDLAVHDAIRKPYSEGKALAIVTPDFDSVIWANGIAAKFFKFETIYDFMDEGLIDRKKTRKKLRETAKQLMDNKIIKTANLRILPKGKDVELALTLEMVKLPKGEDAVMVIVNRAESPDQSEHDVSHVISGFTNTGTCVAVLGRDGEILGATEQLIALDIDDEERQRLTDEVVTEADRLVKRTIQTSKGELPSAIGHLSEDPEMFLLFVIDENADLEGTTLIPDEISEDEMPSDDALVVDAETQSAESEVASSEDTTDESELEQAAIDLAESSDFKFDPNRRAVRFVWRTDAASIFTEISPELGDAIGPNATNILGRRFADVALVFNLNPSEEIIDLIRRRDTWSGKTVMWPVQGTDLSVPVDLAALPTYTRDRLFDGYRGFGVARIQDAVSDPEAIGFALTEGAYEGPNSSSEETTDAKASDDDITSVDEDLDDKIDDDILSPENDPYQGEVPAIDTSSSPKRRESDKVVQLDELRRQAREQLTEDEQAAFFEIREKLGQINNEFDSDEDDTADEDELDSEVSSDEQSLFEDNQEEDLNQELSDLRDALEAEESSEDEQAPIAPELDSNDNAKEAEADGEKKATLIYNSDELLYANETFYRLTGYTNLDQLGLLGGLDHLFIDDPAKVNLQDGAEQNDGEIVIRKADGEHMAVKAVMRVTHWQSESAMKLCFDVSSSAVSSMRDEFDENERLKIKISDLSSILETATDGVVIIDEDGQIQSLNASASALFDYDADETVGQPFAMLFAAESQNSILDYVNAMSAHGVTSIMNDGREVVGRVASGGTLPLSMTMGRLAGSGGYCAVLRDISQSRRAEDELRKAKTEAESANSHKTDFLARVSHEIRTPLNAIIGFSDLISEERFGPTGHPRYVEYAHDISKSGRHVLDIVNDLLDISKIEAGQQELDFKSVNLNTEITEALSIMQQIANENRVVTRSSLPGDVPNVVADQRSIRQILLNILSNSIRFTPAGGQIVVSTSLEPNGHVLLRIRDNGIGMSRAELERAMQPFGQVGQETRQRGDGTGLGLPLTRAMTEANRAKFDIISSPGEGTLVTINFPPQRVLAE